jgi:hypothetical protein
MESLMKHISVLYRLAAAPLAKSAWVVLLTMILRPVYALPQSSDADFVLSGRVQTSGAQMLDAAQLRVEESGSLIFQKTVELASDGSFTVHLGSLHSKQILCTFSAPGFNSQRVTGLTNSTTAVSLGLVRLSPFVELGPVSVARGEGGYAIVDFWVTSHIAKSLTFVNVSITSSQSIAGPCFDSDPILTLRFTMSAQRTSESGQSQSVSTILHIDSGGSEGTHSQPALQVNGEIERDSCGPLMVRLAAPYSFTLTAGDQSTPRKIRLEVPATVAVPKLGTVRPDWDHATVTAEMDTLEKISGSPK